MATVPTQAQPAYETRDARLGPLVKFAFWLSVLTVVTFVSMYGMMRALQELPPLNDVAAHPLAGENDPIPPAPHLEAQRGVKQGWDGATVDLTQRQPFTQRMWVDVKVEASKQLTTYGWIEKDKVVHIPIERAMELVLQKGLKVSQKPKD